MPDTFFRNEKIGAFHNILTPNLYIRVYPDGDVLYSIRISITCACPMHLSLFPLDQQTCTLDIASYGWAKDDLVYVWKDASPVQLANNLSLPGGFQLGAFGSEYCDVVTTTGEYSCLRVKLLFARQLSFFLVTVYVPCSMTVSVSWMSFWLDHKSAPARVALTITTLLAMSTTTSSINSSLPPVAYTKAIDVWNNICVSFVFLALLEYALVNYASRADARAIEIRRNFLNKQGEAGSANLLPQPHGSEAENYQALLKSRRPLIISDRFQEDSTTKKAIVAELFPPHKPRSGELIQSVLAGGVTRSSSSGAKRIDVMARIIFPALFCCLNVIYWSYYLTRADWASSRRISNE